jgi:hypothetical protein
MTDDVSLNIKGNSEPSQKTLNTIKNTLFEAAARHGLKMKKND